MSLEVCQSSIEILEYFKQIINSLICAYDVCVFVFVCVCVCVCVYVCACVLYFNRILHYRR